MKAVLLSVNPLPLEQITCEIKKIEVRKTKPKLPVPFPVYLYETKGKLQRFSSIGYKHVGRGKVIGEFICDAVLPISVTYSDPDSKLALRDFPFTCLTDKDIMDYLGNGKTGYGWHVSDLKIYEHPKELTEFYRHDDSYDNSFGGYFEDRDKKTPLTRPPQSWCYVEELQG